MSQGEPEHLLMRTEEGEAVPRRGDTEARSRPTLDSPLIYLQQVNSVSRSVLLRFGVGGILYPCQSYCSGKGCDTPTKLTEPVALSSVLPRSHPPALTTDKESSGQKEPEETHQALLFWFLLLPDSASPHSSPVRPQLRPPAVAGVKAQPGTPVHLVQSCGDITMPNLPGCEIFPG